MGLTENLKLLGNSNLDCSLWHGVWHEVIFTTIYGDIVLMILTMRPMSGTWQYVESSEVLLV